MGEVPQAGPGSFPAPPVTGIGAAVGPLVVQSSYAGVRELLHPVADRLAAGDRVVVDLGPPGPVDLVLLDGLARLALAARRRGFSVRVDAEPELATVLALAGLDAEVVGLEVTGLEVTGGQAAEPDVVGPDGRPLRLGGLRVEVARQAEAGGEGGVEEVVVPDDPAV